MSTRAVRAAIGSALVIVLLAPTIALADVIFTPEEELAFTRDVAVANLVVAAGAAVAAVLALLSLWLLARSSRAARTSTDDGAPT